MMIREVKRPPTWVRMSSLGGGGDDPIKTAELKLEGAMKPKLEEPAIVHPFNTSIMKIRNNGMIDMFVGTDQGIRIDPYSKTINEIVDGLKWHISYFRGWIDKDAEWYANQRFLFESKESSFNVKTKTSINLNAEENISANAKQDISISCNGRLSLSASGGIDIFTSGGFTIDGQSINIGGAS